VGFEPGHVEEHNLDVVVRIVKTSVGSETIEVIAGASSRSQRKRLDRLSWCNLIPIGVISTIGVRRGTTSTIRRRNRSG
jgi:hypothetical protein